MKSDSQLWMNRVSPQNVFIPKDKGMTQNSLQRLAFLSGLRVAGLAFPDTPLFMQLHKSISFSSWKQRLADANIFTSPGPHLKAGFRVVSQLTLGHRPHLRIPTGGNSGQLLGQNCISSKRAFSPANVSHQTPELVLGLAVLGNSNNWSENASLQRQY